LVAATRRMRWATGAHIPAMDAMVRVEQQRSASLLFAVRGRFGVPRGYRRGVEGGESAGN